jgi:Cu-Zn family superoxide dismutase
MRTMLMGMAAALAMAGSAQAEQLIATMHAVSADGIDQTLGTVTVTPTDAGASFLVQLQGLPGGEHGFHVHAMGNCGPGNNAEGHMAGAMQAGGHWDPQETKAHRGPDGDGHLGDLPVLTAQADGSVNATVVAPRITDVTALRGKALMIHAGGDNYSDEPKPLGGGGARLACGVIQ